MFKLKGYIFYMSLSVTVVQGNVGQEPEFKISKAGKSFIKFSLAVSRNYKGQDGEYGTDWFSVVCFNEATVNYLQSQGFDKGSKAVVKGRMESNKTDSGTYWNLVADEISFTPNQKSEGKRPQASPKKSYGGYAVDDDERPPF